MKKIVISISVATSLFLTSANAGGIPTIDVAAIAQQVMGYQQTLKDYAEQIKQYEQMVKDTMNMEKQMRELGVDMNSVYEILGDTQSMINQMQNIYENVNNIPNDIMGDIARVKTACSFLEQNSQFFGISVKTSSNKLTSKINQCTSALRNGVNLSKSIEEITAKMNASIDPIERASYQAQIANIKNAEKFLQARENATKTDALLAFEDVFHKGDKTNSYSKAKMNDDLNKFAKQLSKANNQKQAQALTNSILLKILEMMQYQYELNINYTSTMASMRQINENNEAKNLTEDSFNQSVVEYKRNDAIFKPETKQLPKDELGLPKFVFKRSN
ncbi:P-type conjugative transfer protein TrbJ [Campylobacter hyointestinalis subsp. hyointestinalis]|uniref:P-type conjugative transfer protein TrbJ n=1 Tax=Campylobacter hyointestinalis subsp. hyointestinalis TaxID=91352 RepID=A0A9W5ASJ6_CAMHY|nr:type IV secretion system protein [Campylobacter hyointestinalis]CUU72389.1 P-type conjugative transfer protein TrbJ [Campylobacter hyointestinalis subsp. hyointestinalis]CUU72407.1 P-type conjugative transfer protein TrbJ [Campylobacter hyointestinalis subsp. hyointestinalis]CUU84580.1 P-type conjugative transfer protein TrbJ [Campylobacter hyointestinalis subsp. hyointestinalis]